MEQTLKILFMAAEATPFAKVGGLADVAGALPAALASLGHDVWLLIPRHRSVAERAELRPRVDPFVVDFDWRPRAAGLYTAALPSGVTLATLVNGDYFDRVNGRNESVLYGHGDDDKRYLFFARIGLEAVRRTGWRPDIVHAHDWHTAAAINWLRVVGRQDPHYRTTATVFTIHNMRHQGLTDLGAIGLLGVEAGGVLPIETERFGGRVNLMARAINDADAVTTVSPTYAREILTPAYGWGLDSLLRRRANDLRGILNGIAVDVFDPARDQSLAMPFDSAHLAARQANTQALQQRLGLPTDERPVIGMVTRLDEQKGLDLIGPEQLEQIIGLGVQIVILGSGEERFERFWRQAQERYPDRVRAEIRFDAALAQLIYGGSDLFLMPSLFEPCGLGQMLAMRYGSVPIVRATGGLVDTVRDADTMGEGGTGFVFEAYTSGALVATIGRALAAYGQSARWRQIMRQAMNQDFSWTRSAREYQTLYYATVDRARSVPSVPSEP